MNPAALLLALLALVGQPDTSHEQAEHTRMLALEYQTVTTVQAPTPAPPNGGDRAPVPTPTPGPAPTHSEATTVSTPGFRDDPGGHPTGTFGVDQSRVFLDGGDPFDMPPVTTTPPVITVELPNADEQAPLDVPQPGPDARVIDTTGGEANDSEGVAAIEQGIADTEPHAPGSGAPVAGWVCSTVQGDDVSCVSGSDQ